MSDVTDINEKRIEKTVQSEIHQAHEQLGGLMGDMKQTLGGGAFARYVEFCVTKIPPTSILQEAWFTASLAAMIGRIARDLPSADAKEFFALQIDFLQESQEPTLCPDCTPGSPEPLTPA